MKPQTRVWVGIFAALAALALGVAPSAKADEAYSTSQPVSWSFPVPARSSANTTGIANFLTFPSAGTTSLGGRNASLTITSPESDVPEPSTLLLVGTGLAALVGLRRKKSNSREYLAYQGHNKRAIRLD